MIFIYIYKYHIKTYYRYVYIENYTVYIYYMIYSPKILCQSASPTGLTVLHWLCRQRHHRDDPSENRSKLLQVVVHYRYQHLGTCPLGRVKSQRPLAGLFSTPCNKVTMSCPQQIIEHVKSNKLFIVEYEYGYDNQHQKL